MQDVDPIAQLEFRIGEIERQMSQMLQMVKVSYVYRKVSDPGIKTDRDDGTWLGHVDVLLTSELELKRRPIFIQRQGEDTSFWLPSEGECGLLLSPSGDVGNSIYLHGIGFDGYPVAPPKQEAVKVHEIRYRDGTKITYNTNTRTDKHSYTLEIPNVPSKIHLKTQRAEFEIVTDKLPINDKIEGKVGTTKFKFNAAKADIRVGAMWMVLTTALANINGFTIVGGTTNLVPGLNTYPPVPAGEF